MAPKTITASLLALATLSAAAPNQADRLKATATKKLLLPSSDTNINNKNQVWASVITQAPSATEYLVACETAFAHPENCDGPFTGVTLTQGPKTMGIELGGTTYQCSLGDEGSAVCATKAAGDAPEATNTLSSEELSLWETDVTVVTVDKAVLELREEIAARAPKGGGGGHGGGGKSSSSGGKSKGLFGGGGSSHDDDEDEDDAADDDNDDDDTSDSFANDDDDDGDDGDDDDDDSSSSSPSGGKKSKVSTVGSDSSDDDNAGTRTRSSFAAIAVAMAALAFAL